MLLSFSVDSLLKHCLSWVSLCTPQWKCSMAVERSWLWGWSILMIMPQFLSVTVDHSVRYNFQKGKGETFSTDMHSVHQAGRDSLPEAGVISTRCCIHQVLYLPGGVGFTRLPLFSTYSQHVSLSWALSLLLLSLLCFCCWFGLILRCVKFFWGDMGKISSHLRCKGERWFFSNLA